MNNSSRFMKNIDCEYYPCHKGINDINCMFCYCPFYSWKNCPGKNEYKDRADGSRIKVCTNCTFPHNPDNYDKVIELLKQGELYINQMINDKKSDGAYSDSNDKGTFYGVGIGPGNEKLITKEAYRTILNSDVIVFPGKDKENCRAYSIAEKAVPEISEKELIFMPFPMSMNEDELATFHRQVADKIEEFLDKNKNVSFLTIGDVSVYSTVIYINDILIEDDYKTVFVAGISSFSAAASRLGIPLTIGSEQLHIVPGSGDIKEALKQDGTIVFMKSGKKLSELKSLLIQVEKSMELDVYAVSNCGMENEAIAYNADEIKDEMGYLTVVIVRHKREE